MAGAREQAPGDGYILVGTLGRPHGVAGWLVLYPETDRPDRFQAGALLKTGRGPALTVKSTRAAGDELLVAFEEIGDRTQAEEWRGAGLFVEATERRPLAADEFWPESLIGLQVRGLDGAELGVVSDVELGGAQDRIRVEGGGKSTLVPLVRALVPEIDLAAGYLVIDPVPGLMEP
jgi:16S rRNA processing protein RimM